MVNSSDNSVQDTVLAKVGGQDFAIPDDLYIPPDALQVLLESFEGPLDLLLYLIRRQKLDILDLNVAKITEQYLQYMALMQDLKIDLAAEYMLMSATLIEIKSRLLLPKPESDQDEELIDPRAELMRRLQVYEQFKLAAQNLDEMTILERDVWRATVIQPQPQEITHNPRVELADMLRALTKITHKRRSAKRHMVELELLSVRERMTEVLCKIVPHEFCNFSALYTKQEGRQGVVVSLLAILELQRQNALYIKQLGAFAPIYIKALASEVSNED